MKNQHDLVHYLNLRVICAMKMWIEVLEKVCSWKIDVQFDGDKNFEYKSTTPNFWLGQIDSFTIQFGVSSGLSGREIAFEKNKWIF